MAQENMERRLQHLFDGNDWNVYDTSMLNLGVGAPSTDLLANCCDIFRQATEHRLKIEKESNSSLLFQYGPTSGTYEARSAIAQYFTRAYGSMVKSEDLVITSGATQGLHLILSTLLDFNGYVFVDEVTYMIALDSIKQFTSLTIVPVRLNDDGVDIEDLERVLKEKQFKSHTKEFWAMYYTIPTYHNPTGILFSADICRALIQLARKYDILITCDDVYNVLNYTDSEAPKRLIAYDSHEDTDFRGNVISNGSFSKIIAPGIRVGWLEVPARVKPQIDGCGIANSGGCFNNYTAGILASLFDLQLAQSHIHAMYMAYKERMLAMCAVLERDLPAGCTLVAPRGGYFIWIRLPAAVDARDFQRVCLSEQRIFFIPGSRFSARDNDSAHDTAKNCLRLSIAFHSKAKLIDGAQRFCSALKNFLKSENVTPR